MVSEYLNGNDKRIMSLTSKAIGGKLGPIPSLDHLSLFDRFSWGRALCVFSGSHRTHGDGLCENCSKGPVFGELQARYSRAAIQGTVVVYVNMKR